MILKIRRDSQLGGFKLQLLIIAMVFIQLAVGFSDLISASRVGGSFKVVYGWFLSGIKELYIMSPRSITESKYSSTTIVM